MNETNATWADEEWRPFTFGVTGHYAVSSHGRVKRLRTHYMTSRNGRPAAVSLPERMMVLRRTRSGHATVLLSDAGTAKVLSVHRMVLTLFVGPCPVGMEACHNNGDPRDNRVSNLRWDTITNNRRDRSRHDGGTPRLSFNDDADIARARREGASLRTLSTKYGVSDATILRAIRRHESGWNDRIKAGDYLAAAGVTP